MTGSRRLLTRFPTLLPHSGQRRQNPHSAVMHDVCIPRDRSRRSLLRWAYSIDCHWSGLNLARNEVQSVRISADARPPSSSLQPR
jgi:hypothetical protein